MGISSGKLWVDPENHQFLMETSLPTPMTARVELLIYQRVSSGNFSPFAIGYIYRMVPPSYKWVYKPH